MVDKSGFLFVYFHASLVSWLIGGQTNQTDQAEKACEEKDEKQMQMHAVLHLNRTLGIPLMLTWYKIVRLLSLFISQLGNDHLEGLLFSLRVNSLNLVCRQDEKLYCRHRKKILWSSLLQNHPIITIITNFESVTDWNFWWKQFAAFFHSSVNGLPPHCVMWRCHCDDSKIVDIRSSLAVLKHTRHQVWILIQLISVDFYLIENNSFCLSDKKSRHWFISGHRT